VKNKKDGRSITSVINGKLGGRPPLPRKEKLKTKLNRLEREVTEIKKELEE
jgi:hypothetical protein